MDVFNSKAKKGLITKTWRRCRSIGSRGGNHTRKRHQVAPEGCFSVYVGPHRQRFVIKTEYANHPLFQLLLEEAELEYGYNSEGPIALPCDVDLFVKVLVEMDGSDEIHQGCGFAKGYGSFRLLSPSRLVAMNNFY